MFRRNFLQKVVGLVSAALATPFALGSTKEEELPFALGSTQEEWEEWIRINKDGRGYIYCPYIPLNRDITFEIDNEILTDLRKTKQ